VVGGARHCRTQSDHSERSDLSKRFFIAGGRGGEPREGEREGQVLKYSSVRLGMI
jgi:hypothetical protein